jgi:hypothetical protein
MPRRRDRCTSDAAAASTDGYRASKAAFSTCASAIPTSHEIYG